MSQVNWMDQQRPTLATHNLMAERFSLQVNLHKFE